MSRKSALPGVDYVTLDYEGFRNLMLDKLSELMPEYTDRSKTDAGIVILELNAIALDILSYYVDTIANEVFLTTARQRGSVLEWCRLLGYTPREAVPARFEQVFRLSKIRSTDFLIPKGTVVSTDPLISEEAVYYETVSDLIIPAGSLGIEVNEQGNPLYSVEVVQGSTISNELLGTSNGTADQAFTLKYSPALPDSIVVKVDEGDSFKTWQRVFSFVDNTNIDRHFITSVDELNYTKVIFGNGVFGKIPVEVPNGMYCTYRVGGGTMGNVGSGKINTLGSNLAEISATYNHGFATTPGEDRETIEEIKTNAAAALRALWGALTLKDYSGVVKIHFPAVKHVQAYRSLSEQDDIDIFIYNDLAFSVSFSELQEGIVDFFSADKGGRQLVGIGEVNVLEAIPQTLWFTINLRVKDDYSAPDVALKVEEALAAFLAPGEFGIQEMLSMDELDNHLLATVPGIRYVRCKVTSSEEVEHTPARGSYFAVGGITELNVTGGF